MINIEYNREKHSVHVDGHAGAGESGHDIVCAAVSILLHTLAGNVDALRDGVKRPHIVLDEGKGCVECSHAAGYKGIVTLIFDSIAMGFAMVADTYPEFVTYIRRDR